VQSSEVLIGDSAEADAFTAVLCISRDLEVADERLRSRLDAWAARHRALVDVMRSGKVPVLTTTGDDTGLREDEELHDVGYGSSDEEEEEVVEVEADGRPPAKRARTDDGSGSAAAAASGARGGGAAGARRRGGGRPSKAAVAAAAARPAAAVVNSGNTSEAELIALSLALAKGVTTDDPAVRFSCGTGKMVYSAPSDIVRSYEVGES